MLRPAVRRRRRLPPRRRALGEVDHPGVPGDRIHAQRAAAGHHHLAGPVHHAGAGRGRSLTERRPVAGLRGEQPRLIRRVAAADEHPPVGHLIELRILPDVLLRAGEGGPGRAAGGERLGHLGDVRTADRAAKRERAAIRQGRDRRVPPRVVQVGQGGPLQRGRIEVGGVGGADPGAVVASGGQQTSIGGQDVAGAEQLGEAVRDRRVDVGRRIPQPRRWRAGYLPRVEEQQPTRRHDRGVHRDERHRERRGPLAHVSRRALATNRGRGYEQGERETDGDNLGGRFQRRGSKQ